MKRNKRERRERAWAAFYAHLINALGPTLTKTNRCSVCRGAILDGASPSVIVHKPGCAGVERTNIIAQAFDTFMGDFL